MRNLTTTLFAGGLSVLMGMTSFVPAQAITMPSISVSSQSDVQQVRNTRIKHRQHVRRGNNRNYHNYGNRYRNGRHNRTGAILGGVAAGVIIGGALGAASSHQSCANRYRSYRASDNTYQPYSGPRRLCVSR